MQRQALLRLQGMGSSRDLAVVGHPTGPLTRIRQTAGKHFMRSDLLIYGFREGRKGEVVSRCRNDGTAEAASDLASKAL